MPPTSEVARWVIAAVVTAVLAWAAVSDVRERRIPNRAVLIILILFLPWAAVHPLSSDLWALAAGAIALAATFGLYAAGVVGAGDSKLFAAVALFAGMSQLPLLALTTALVGGLIAVVSLAARPQRALVMLTLRGKGDFGRGVPYGVAIALAGAAVIWAVLMRAPLPGLI
jgi:prepilin peptidase CpaA